jgi:hypothetical protein
MIQLPDYFVRKVAGYPAGIRMPKMEKWYADNWPKGFVNSHNHTHYPILSTEGDPLSGGDYRYWCGVPAATMFRKGYAQCRCCGEVVVHKKERKEHKQKGCGSKLEEAYKMLRRSTECIMCKLATHRKVYGLPLCCKDCEFEWEFTTATPRVLRYVLEEVGK